MHAWGFMSARKQKFEIPTSPDLSFEFAIAAKDLFPIAGLDEAGRGAWAGPVCAAAVILPINPEILQKSIRCTRFQANECQTKGILGRRN